MTDRLSPTLAAIQDFRRARQQANLDNIIANLTGRPSALLSFDQVKHQLKGSVSGRRRLEDVPLDVIVGSVGRYIDFNRQFLPQNDSDENRWARVKSAMESPTGVPPIELYRIGDAYFVLDGNHRVSVLRRIGATHAQAYVTEIQTRVPLSPHDSPDDLILKAEYANFLDRTRLDEQRPGVDLSVTSPGRYAGLEEEIEAHRAAMSAEQGRDVPFDQAAASWYDTIYLPVIDIIRRQGILEDFPQRTETDLYVWVSQHRAELEQQLGWHIGPAAAASDLANQRGQTARRVAARLGGRLLGAVTPALLETGPPPGEWRRDRGATLEQARLAANLLVPISGEPAGWYALEQALVVARREDGRIAGLHVVRTPALRDSREARAVRDEFDRRCADAGVPGNLAIEAGSVTDLVCDRARWNDVVVVNLAYPPSAAPVARLRNGFRALVQRCPRPILAAPQRVTPLSRALLAYDGSPKADEALYAATYLALQWQIPLVVVSVVEGEHGAKTPLDSARQYLESHGVAASYAEENGPVADAILRAATAQASDLILIGGYGFNPLLEAVIGSTVDQVLRETRQPVLICR
ncbi:MAG TPA: universal stress protein [Roseiflexaceae bacterium]|nr:universal stress protein [Roseiflexaceae bacterium]